MFWPCETRTSTCRNFATISSGVYRFFGIAVLLHVKRHSSGRTTSKGEDHVCTLRADFREGGARARKRRCSCLWQLKFYIKFNCLDHELFGINWPTCGGVLLDRYKLLS